MKRTTVVNVKTTTTDQWDVYIGRGRCPKTGMTGPTQGRYAYLGPWGLGNRYSHLPSSYAPAAQIRVKDRNEAVYRYAEDAPKDPHIMRCLENLRGQSLACHCHPLLCHGHVLAVMADMPTIWLFSADWQEFLDALANGTGLTWIEHLYSTDSRFHVR